MAASVLGVVAGQLCGEEDGRYERASRSTPRIDRRVGDGFRRMLDDLATSTPKVMATSTNTSVPRATSAVATPTVPVIPTSPGSSSGLHSLRAMVCLLEFIWPCGWAHAVIACESGWNPNAQGVEVIGGVTYYFNGLWQVWNGPFDPYLNTVEAHIQYVEWQAGERANPWPNCP